MIWIFLILSVLCFLYGLALTVKKLYATPMISRYKKGEYKKGKAFVVAYEQRQYGKKFVDVPVLEYFNEYTNETIRNQILYSDVEEDKFPIGSQVQIDYLKSGSLRVNDPEVTKKNKYNIKSYNFKIGLYMFLAFIFMLIFQLNT